MSLICDETEHDIEYGTPLHASTRADVPVFCAISYEILEKIPESHRTYVPMKKGWGGIDIHEASSGRNFNGSYMIMDFRLGRYLYSLSQEIVDQYMPNHAEKMRGHIIKYA